MNPRLDQQLQSAQHLAAPKFRHHCQRSAGTLAHSMANRAAPHTGVWKIKGADGFGNFWASCAEVSQWSSVRNMNLSYCSLTTLPSVIGQLGMLRILRLSHNKLTALPPEIGNLSALEVLAADHNLLTSVPGTVYAMVHASSCVFGSVLFSASTPQSAASMYMSM